MTMYLLGCLAAMIAVYCLIRGAKVTVTTPQDYAITTMLIALSWFTALFILLGTLLDDGRG